MRSTAGTSWTCPSCEGVAPTLYCPACGERRLAADDLTLRQLFGQMARAFSSIDGRLLRSLRALVTSPGELTLAYLQGRRKPYVAPLQLFLLMNVLFFALQSFTGANIFSTPLDSHLHQQIWSPLAQRLVARHLAATGIGLDLYAPVFDQSVTLHAKSLIILMVLPFALIAAILFSRRGIPVAGHVVFSLYFYSFLLLMFCAALVFVGVDRLFGGDGLGSERLDHVLSAVEVAVCATYLYLAIGTIFRAGRIARVFQAVLLVLATASIVLGYRFALFLITLYGA